MNPMQLFYIIWFIVLPIIAILLIGLIPVVWFFIVPKVARRLTWARFGKANIIALSDDAGWTDLLVSRKGLPEGVLQHGDDWSFLPRPRYKKGEESENGVHVAAQSIILRKSILLGHGKPFWHGYAGKIQLINPSTTAALTQSSSKNPAISLEKINLAVGKLKGFAESLDKHIKKSVLDYTKGIEEALKFTKEMLEGKIKKIEYTNPKTAIKENLPQMYTPSQIVALAKNRELYGMEKRGKEYGKLIMGMGFILGLIIICIMLIMFAK